MKKSTELIAKQKKHLWPNQILYYADPLPLDHGEGMYVWDVDGNKYLDFFAGILTTSVGHNNGRVRQRINEQLVATQMLQPVFEPIPTLDRER